MTDNKPTIRQKVNESLGFMKTTAIGGLIFLLPLLVVVVLLGYIVEIVYVIYEPLQEELALESPWLLWLLFLTAIVILLLLCFICGFAARRAVARRFTQKIEKKLVMVFPKYAIYKDIVAGNLGSDELAPTLQPITVQLDDMIRIGYEAGRTLQGLVIVYLPGSPDPWIGSVALVEPHRVTPLEVDFNETAAICERLGRDSTSLLSGIQRTSKESTTPGRSS